MELAKLKALLGIPEEDTGRDVALQFLLDDVQETILNYCNLVTLPEGLTNTAYRMAMDLYRYERPGEDAAPLAVTSISEGDTSTGFGNAADALAGGILKNYQTQLNRYRKLRW
ncbi:MAG: phage head-tail connector protein [Eubacteriales bacterium]|nr:phage head-tail connector protein [Eubacteriales bacterium]